jgi:hypothetical protein
MQPTIKEMDQDEYYNIVSAISNFKDEYGEEPSGQELFDLAYSIGVEPDDVINVMYGRVVPNKAVFAALANSKPL